MKTSSKPSENNFSSKNEKLISDLASRLIEAQKSINVFLSKFQQPLSLQEAKSAIENIILRFHLVAKDLSERQGSRPPLIIKNEYDVQDLLEALLRLHFDDVKREQPTPEHAGSSTRIDFLLSQEQIGIEVKMTRKGLGKKELGDELIIDIAHYVKHPECRMLYCFVYDPNENIKNPRAIERDLSVMHGNLEVKVFIVPKRA
jgi:hypothetical protein